MGDPLDEMIGECERLARFPEEVARRAAPRLQRALRATAAAGTDPYGKPWPPTKEGDRALPNAAKAIAVVAEGSSVRASIGAPYSYQKRQILPTEVTPAVAAALDEAAEAAWRGDP